MAATELSVLENTLKAYRPIYADLVAPYRSISADRIIRSVIISCERTPKLLACDRMTIIQAATTGAVLGLEADGVTGQGFLVPFKKRVQWLTGYKGYNTLAGRAGFVINAGVVHEGDDKFDFQEGSGGFVRHKRALNKGGGRRLVAAWAVAERPGYANIVVVMDRDQLDAVREKSQAAKRDDSEAGSFSPWNEPLVGFPAMCEKTCRRRISRSMPLSPYLWASAVDEAHEERGRHAWINQNREVVVEGQVEPLVINPQPGSPIGPSLAQLRNPGYILRGQRGDITLPTIEQWRDRWMDEIPKMSAASAEDYYERNTILFDDYSRRHPEATKQVVDAVNLKRRE